MSPTEAEAAVAVVQRQVDAFNAKDIEAFVACYTFDARIYRPLLQEAPTLVGRAAMRTAYGPALAADPEARVVVEHRHLHDGLVFDVELFPATERRVTLAFEVEHGLITRSWVFSPPLARPEG